MEKIKEFLTVNYGNSNSYGDGNGSGYGSGYGNGSGHGYGDGDNNGDGSGYGDNFGVGCGDGSGSGYDNGSGYGSGVGYGDSSGVVYGGNFGVGYGDGSGSGYGSGNGSGYGSGYGISKFNGKTVYLIDGVQTIITHVKSNIAKGYILNSDLTLTPCFVLKRNNLFAHGETLKKAQEALWDKLFEGLSVEERISEFNKEFRDGKKYPVAKFFDWHNKLTGSCEMGRKSFAKYNGIDLEHDEMTVDEFITLTKNAYGGKIIRKIKNN